MGFKIGVMADSFRLTIDKDLEKSREVGAQGVQIYATFGEMSPDNITEAGIAAKKAKLASCGLEVSALCGDFGGHGFMDPAENEWKVEKSERVVDLATKFDCHVVTTHIGTVPDDKTGETYSIMLKVCRELGRYAANKGVTFAIETGPEKAKVLRSFLDEVATPGIGVNLDPANLVMVAQDDPVAAVDILAPYIVHTHAKDGIHLDAEDPAQPGICYRELPLGQGKVDFDRYLAALRAHGYQGYLTIEREVGDNPFEDIRLAVEFLKSKI